MKNDIYTLLIYVFHLILFLLVFGLAIQMFIRALFPNGGNANIGNSIGKMLTSFVSFVFRLFEKLLLLFLDLIVAIFGGTLDMIVALFKQKKKIYGSARFLTWRERRQLFSKKK